MQLDAAPHRLSATRAGEPLPFGQLGQPDELAPPVIAAAGARGQLAGVGEAEAVHVGVAAQQLAVGRDRRDEGGVADRRPRRRDQARASGCSISRDWSSPGSL